MSVTLNHSIVWCSDKNASARYLTGTEQQGEARRFAVSQLTAPDGPAL